MRPISTEGEAALVERSRDGHQEAFEELVRRHAEQLYAVILGFVANPQEAEEATQEAFLRAWRGIGSFEGRSQFFTWLCRIGINEAKRRSSRRPTAETWGPEALEEAPLEHAPDWSEAPETQLAQSELRVVLEREIRALEPAYRATIILRDVEGLSTREAAEIMSLSETAFKSRLHRARLALRETLNEYFPASSR